MVVAPDLTVLYVPEYVTECIGLTQTEIIGQNLLDLTHSDDQNSVERNLIYDPTGPICCCCCFSVVVFFSVVVLAVVVGFFYCLLLLCFFCCCFCC